ncbi:MAG: hypothetical protein JKY67_16080 [Pseudomonadales bacterium]|nr:hypothetical protein [Pseudomonadales bacterium]
MLSLFARAFVQFGILLLSILFTIPSFATEIPFAKQYQLVEINGIDVPEINGIDFNHLTVFAYRNGVLAPIPFQFEDIDSDGNTYFEKGDAPLMGSKDIFDEHDALFFLFSDAGQQLYPFPVDNTRILSEIRLSFKGGSRYVYIATGMIATGMTATGTNTTEGATAATTGAAAANMTLSASAIPDTSISATNYVNYNKETGLIETSRYTLQTDPKNFLVWKSLHYNGLQSDDNTDFIDALKIRISAGIIAKYPRITLTNKNFFVDVVDIKEGPVRSVLLLNSKVKVAGFTVLYVNFHITIIPSEVELEVRVKVPSIFKYVVNSPNTSLSLECKNMQGGIFRTALGPSQPAIIDGHISPLEQNLIRKGIDNDHTWIGISSRKNMDLFATMFISDNFTAPITLYYRDEKPGKRGANLGPNIGYRVHDIPVDASFKFQFKIVIGGGIGQREPLQFAQGYKTQPNVATYSNPTAIKLATKLNTSQ